VVAWFEIGGDFSICGRGVPTIGSRLDIMIFIPRFGFALCGNLLFFEEKEAKEPFPNNWPQIKFGAFLHSYNH